MLTRWRSRVDARAAPLTLLLALALLSYSNSFSGTFEGDSGQLIPNNLLVRHASMAHARELLSHEYWYGIADSGLYRPLVSLSWMLNYAVLGNGDRAAGFHVVNLAIHLANVTLAWLLVLGIWKRPLPAFFTAAIFALHPVNVESVTNVAGRADLMAGLGVLAGMLLHNQQASLAGRRRWAALGGLAAAALFGFFSKENAAILPAAMLLYDVVFRSRHQVRALVPGYLVVAPALAAMFVVRHWVLAGLPTPERPFVDNPLVGAPFWTARLTALGVIWREAALLLWPQALSWDHSYNQIPMVNPAAGVAALAGVAAALVLLLTLRRKHAPACFFGLFFFLALGPTSNVLVLIGSIMAERFLYLPSIGFAGCLVAAVFAISRRVWPGKATVPAAAMLAVMVALLGVRTFFRNFEWTDGDKLWQSAARASPNSFRAHLAPVYGIFRQGLNTYTVADAIEEARKAVDIVDGLPPVRSTAAPLTTLGALYLTKGDLLALRPEPDAREIHECYLEGLDTLLRAVPIDEAYREDRRRTELARGLPPERIPIEGNGLLYENLADAYRRLGRVAEAADTYEYLLTIAPLDPHVYLRFADLELVMGHREESVIRLWEAFDLDPAPATELQLVAAYRDLAPQSCALAGSKLDRTCPVVKAHICTAGQGLVRQLVESGRPRDAARFRRTALHDRGCALP